MKLDQIAQELSDKGLCFTSKPILIGGNAMEYYGLRKAGADIDLVICDDDYQSLARRYPAERKDLYGDLGVVLWPFEIWRSIALLGYDFFEQDAIEHDALRVVSLERLLFTRVIARSVEKYNNDLQMLVNFYYDRYRAPSFLAEAETHTASYQKHNGAVFGGQYND